MNKWRGSGAEVAHRSLGQRRRKLARKVACALSACCIQLHMLVLSHCFHMCASNKTGGATNEKNVSNISRLICAAPPRRLREKSQVAQLTKAAKEGWRQWAIEMAPIGAQLPLTKLAEWRGSGA